MTMLSVRNKGSIVRLVFAGCAAVCVSAILAVVAVTTQAQTPQGVARSSGIHRGRGGKRQGQGGRRLGHRPDQGAADTVHQDRGHGRRRPFRAARVAVRDVQPLGARLWPR